MAIAQHPKNGGSFACQKMWKKKQNQFLESNAFIMYAVWNYYYILTHNDLI